jgi:hypothetical protein
MDPDSLDDLVRRLTALVVKIDERDTDTAALLARHDTRIEQHAAHMALLEAAIGELRSLSRQSLGILERLEATQADLKTLMREVFRDRHNGQET